FASQQIVLDSTLIMFNNETTLKGFSTHETPFYYYDLNLLEDTLDAAKKAADKYGFHIHYALKANFNERILALIQSKGFGADCVSGNEVQKSIDMGFPASQITFAGVGKADKEIKIALQHQILHSMSNQSKRWKSLMHSQERWVSRLMSPSASTRTWTRIRITTSRLAWMRINLAFLTPSLKKPQQSCAIVLILIWKDYIFTSVPKSRI